ncbi:terminase large subunit [Magnetococcales bacterium HHB-1]
MPTIKFHPKQWQAISSDKRIINMVSGIQGGKTICGASWLFNKVTANTESNVNWLVTAPTYPIFTQATEPQFLKFFAPIGEYNRTDKIFKMNNNRNIFLRTLSNPNAIEGMTNVRGIWNDEVAMNSSKAWINIEGRSAFSECQIFNSTTPYALNWLWRDLYKPWKEGKRPDVEFIQFRSVDNPFFPKQEFERQQRLLDPKVFAMKYCGQFERMAGLVYDLDDTLNFLNEPGFIPNNRDYYVVAGVDFGHNNPFAVSIRAIHRKEERDYQIGEFYKQFLDTTMMVKACRVMQEAHGIEAFYCDSENPQAIADLNRAGLSAYPVSKGKDSVYNGILAHYALLKSGEHKLVTGKCPHTEDEYATYHYAEDEGKEENQPEKPVDAHNHLMDANRYVTMATKEFRRARNDAAKPKVYNSDYEIEKELYGIADPTEEVVEEEDWYGD